MLLDGLVAAADAAFSVRNGTTEPGVTQPAARERSGSPESQVSWASLGRQGRSFTGTGPFVADHAFAVFDIEGDRCEMKAINVRGEEIDRKTFKARK